MKKKLVFIIVFLTILMNVFSFVHINKNLINNLLFDKAVVTFQFNDSIILDKKFLNKIVTFSKEENVEISQYSFLSNNKIDIYSTDKDKYNKILLIPNLLYNKDIKVHNFEDIYNVGFKNSIYLDSKSRDVINEFSKKFSEYGKIYVDLESGYGVSNFSLYNIVKYLDGDFLSINCLLIFIYTLILIFYYLNKQKEYLIYELWGYSHFQIYCKLNKIIFNVLFATITAINIFMIGIIYVLNLEYLLNEFIYIINILNLAMILLLFIISIILFKLIFINLNKKNTTVKMKIFAVVFKICLLLIITLSFKNLLYQSENLNKSKESLSSWKSTEKLYNIYQSYSPAQKDLSLEYEMNKTILKVYKELSNSDKVFMIDSVNFSRPTTLNTSEDDLDYNYKYNVKNNADLYSPHGININVDTNYLKRHLIITSEGKKNVLNKINYNDNVLNVLVPKKLKPYENNIIKSYKEWFHFYKVEVLNIYEEAKNEELSNIPINDLNINLIYIQNNQSYFTYNTSSGNHLNKIKDPIVTVYTENIDNSFLASTLGGSIFLESKNEYSALNEVKNITQKYNATELNNILSVYDQKGEEISFIEDTRDKLILNTSVMFFILISLMVLMTYIYYKTYISKIIIKSLYGYKFIDIYKTLLLSNLYVYILVYLFITIVYKEISLTLTLVTIFMLFIDFITINIVNRFLISKGEIKLIKGELI